MDVSIIIVNYHSAKMIVDCVKTIYKKTKGATFEIIVVDNASKDDSISILKNNLKDKIKIVESHINLGFGKANNLGARFASGRYLFLLNPDTLLINDAVSILINYLDQNKNVGIAGGNLFSPDLKPIPSFCIKFDDLKTEKKSASWNNLIFKKIKTKLLSKSNKKLNEFNYSSDPCEVAYIFGADIMIKKSLFDEIKGFDPDFFMYAEEEEMSWRVTKLNYSIVNVPNAKIVHLEGATTNGIGKFSERQFRMRINGTLTYFFKRFGKDGAKEFYKMRLLRYNRLIKIAKLQGKNTIDFLPTIQKKCLDEEYNKFLKNI